MSLEDKMDILEVIAPACAYTHDGRDADGFAQLFAERVGFLRSFPQEEVIRTPAESRAAIHAWASQRHQQVIDEIHDRHYQSGTLFDVLTQEHAQTRTMVLITHQGVHDPTPRPRAFRRLSRPLAKDAARMANHTAYPPPRSP